MDLIETGWEGMDWIHLVHDRGQWQALCQHSKKSLDYIKGTAILN
jgi:hypothetical protein